MSSQDAIANHLVVIARRFLWWVILVLGVFLTLWTLVWVRWLGYPWASVLDQLRAMCQGSAMPWTQVVFWLSTATAVGSISLVFALVGLWWSKKGQLQGYQVRGAWMDGGRG